VAFLTAGIEQGFFIGFEGPDASYVANNMKSISEHPKVVQRYLEEEISLGRIQGPFTRPPFHPFRSNQIGVVEKKNSGKFRTIMNLSHPKGVAVNEYISKEDYSLTYVTVDTAIEKILALGRGCLLTKVDVEKAFRVIPVHPSQWHLLGFSWNGGFYFDTVLSMGGRSSPYLFNVIADAAEWVCKNNYSMDFLIHLLDDFLSVEERGGGQRSR